MSIKRAKNSLSYANKRLFLMIKIQIHCWIFNHRCDHNMIIPIDCIAKLVVDRKLTYSVSLPRLIYNDLDYCTGLSITTDET